MNNKGQALVEFVLILPLFLMILFVIVDMGCIFSSKARLESDTYDIVDLLKNGTSLEEVRKRYDKIEINIKIQDSYQIVLTKEDVKLITPGIYRILDNPFEIEVERAIPYET